MNKTKTLILTLIFFSFFIILGGYGRAAACSGVPVSSCTVADNTTYTMPQNTYYNLQSVTISGRNASIDCNNSILIGNSTGYPLQTNQHNNTFINCYVAGNYTGGIAKGLSNKDALIIKNSQFYGNYSSRIIDQNGYFNQQIYNVTFNPNWTSATDCIREYGTGLIIENSTFYQCDNALDIGGNNAIIKYSQFHQSGNKIDISHQGIYNLIVYKNVFNSSNMTNFGNVYSINSINVTVANNNFSAIDFAVGSTGAVRASNITALLIENNSLTNVGMYMNGQRIATTIRNNIWTNISSGAAIRDYGSGSANISVLYNIINNARKDTFATGVYNNKTYCYGFLVQSTGIQWNVSYNNVTKVDGLITASGMSNSDIGFNLVNESCTEGYGISMDSASNYLSHTNNSFVHNNTFYRGGHDTLVVIGYNNIISGNKLFGLYHHGIELSTPYDVTGAGITGGNNSIFENYIAEDGVFDDPDYNTTAYCYFALQSVGSRFYNNTCMNSTIMGGYGNNSYGNTFEDNYIDCRNPLFPNIISCVSLPHNTTFARNRLFAYAYNGLDLSSGGAHIIINRNSSIHTSNILLLNNNYTIDGGGIVTLYQSNFYSNVTLNISESSMPPLSINFAGSTYANLSYTGRKSITHLTTTQNFSIYNQQLSNPSADVKQNLVYINANIDNISYNLSNTNNIVVLDGGCDTILTNGTNVSWSNLPCFPSANANGSFTRNSSLNITANVPLTFTLKNFLSSFPYNDVKNVSTDTILNYGIDNQSYTLQSGQQITVDDQVQISSVSSVVANTNVDVSWTTLRRMNSSVLFLGSLNDNVTSHLIHLSGLTAGTTYYFNISVCDYLGSAGCKTYDNGYSFTTGQPASSSSDSSCSTARSGIVSAFSEFPVWFTIMFVVLVMGILVGGAMFMFNRMDLDINLDGLGAAIVPVLIASIILILGIVILSSMC